MFTYLCNKFSFLKETKIFTPFFDKVPSLYLSLFALFGYLYGKTSDWVLLTPLLPLLFHRIRFLILGLALFCLFFASVPSKEKIEIMKGSGIFSIRDVQEQKGFLILKGKLHHWNGVTLNLPATLRVKKVEEAKIQFHKRLFLTGSIKEKKQIEIYATHVEANSPSRFSFPWLRFYIKQKLQRLMEKNHPNGAILSSLLFGSPVPKHIATSIKRFGLSHLFAISGFHFNLITTLLALMLRPFVSYRIFHWVILTLLTIYALLIGPNPSLLRGFLAQAILFLGLALRKNSLGLNSLGAALFFITLFFPDLVTNLGFIFSFIITFALLLLYPLVSRLLP
jgi:ComEC/Rec2-related protein